MAVLNFVIILIQLQANGVALGSWEIMQECADDHFILKVEHGSTIEQLGVLVIRWLNKNLSLQTT